MGQPVLEAIKIESIAPGACREPAKAIQKNYFERKQS
jgi:hypothetical protein